MVSQGLHVVGWRQRCENWTAVLYRCAYRVTWRRELTRERAERLCIRPSAFHRPRRTGQRCFFVDDDGWCRPVSVSDETPVIVKLWCDVPRLICRRATQFSNYRPVQGAGSTGSGGMGTGKGGGTLWNVPWPRIGETRVQGSGGGCSSWVQGQRTIYCILRSQLQVKYWGLCKARIVQKVLIRISEIMAKFERLWFLGWVVFCLFGIFATAHLHVGKKEFWCIHLQQKNNWWIWRRYFLLWARFSLTAHARSLFDWFFFSWICCQFFAHDSHSMLVNDMLFSPWVVHCISKIPASVGATLTGTQGGGAELPNVGYPIAV